MQHLTSPYHQLRREFRQIMRQEGLERGEHARHESSGHSGGLRRICEVVFAGVLWGISCVSSA